MAETQDEQSTNGDPADHSPERRNARMRAHWEDQMARDRQAGNGISKPAASVLGDTIAETLATRKNRLDNLEAELKGMDGRATTLRKRKETYTPKERIEIERELSSLAVMRDTCVLMVSEGQASLLEAQKRHQQAQHDAANRLDDVISSIGIAARAYREALRSALTALQTIEGTAASIEILTGPLKLTKQAHVAALVEVGLAPRYLDMPGMGALRPQTLEQNLETYAANARMRRAELKQKGQRE